ncbi:MAG TPA: hypothetical protein VFS19_06175 [Planctomycetota bacterium]|nr:hypothetical protein [Planctomycetota bacterium]
MSPMKLLSVVAVLALLAGCGGPQLLSVMADPTDARISYSSTGPSGTFIPAGKGKASVAVEFKADAQGNPLPFIVRVSKDGFATQDFEYQEDATVPESIVVRLDTVRAVETRELDRTTGGLVVVTRVALAEVEEIERSPNVKSVTRVTNYRNEERKFVNALDVSPDPAASRIVFELSETEAVKEIDPATRQDTVRYNTVVNLWTTTAGQTGITRLSYSKSGFDTSPTFSRDGQFIYYSSTRGGNPLIWRTRAVGSGGITRITSGTSQYFDPHASQDHVVYTEFFSKDRPSLLWVSNLEGGLPTQLREGESGRWSADGKRIVYLVPDRNLRRRVQQGAGQWTEIPITKIWMMDADGGNPTQLTFGDSMDIDPTWSPDGTRITYASDQGKDAKGRSNFDIWMMNSDGTQTTQLTTNGSEDVRPVWDPNGKHIYFRSNRGMGVNIWRMEPAR